jgi:ribose-phosphate pyrophosphokinase
VGALLGASGLSEVLTVDVHSPRARALFPVPVISLSPAPLFADIIAGLGLGDPTVVAPDEGARSRCESVRQAAGIGRPVAWFSKARGPEGIAHSPVHGAVGRQAILVDDILDTGATLLSACEALRRAGTQEIVIMATHGLFSGPHWKRLWKLGVTRIYCTDTNPRPPAAAAEPITVLSVASLLATHVGRLSGVEEP